MCPHAPPCPAPSAPDREAARTIVSHPEQGWSLLCNGVVIFDDTGELLPGGAFIAPHRPTDLAAFYRPAGVAPGHGGQAPAALPEPCQGQGQGRPRPPESPRLPGGFPAPPLPGWSAAMT
jgi:Family of unknown function (DUF5999)